MILKSITDGLLIIAYGVYCSAKVLVKMCDAKLDAYYIYIDFEKRKLFIKCSAQKIPYENFRVYTKYKNKNAYLYIKGAYVNENSKDIITVEHKYLLKKVTQSELMQRICYINECDEFVVEIPLDELNGVYAKRIK